MIPALVEQSGLIVVGFLVVDFNLLLQILVALMQVDFQLLLHIRHIHLILVLLHIQQLIPMVVVLQLLLVQIIMKCIAHITQMKVYCMVLILQCPVL